MDDEPIVISSGTLYTPESVAIKTFATSFRGYDQSEVRAYLKRVADELSAAAARETELREAVLEAHKRAANPVLDEETLTAALGEHAAHLLSQAREAAANIVAEAEKRAARIIGEAEVRIARVRSEADGLLARRSEEADRMTSGVRQAAEASARTLRDRARAEAEAEVESARKQGREMVGEARAVRERMLADLTRRRRTAEVQIDHLRLARQRLLEAYAVVRRTLDEATHELGAAEAEAGPVLDAAAGRPPRDIDGDRGGAGARGTDDAGRSPSDRHAGQRRPALAAPSAQELAGSPGRAHGSPRDIVAREKRSSAGGPGPDLEVPMADTPNAEPKVDPPKVDAPKVDAPKVDAPKVDVPKVDVPKVDAPKVDAPKVDAPKVDAPKVDAPKVDAPKVDAPKVGASPAAATNADDLFARLRAAQASAPTTETHPPVATEPKSAPGVSGDPGASSSPHPGNGVATTPPSEPANPAEGAPVSGREESALAWRDRLLEPIEADLIRRLKRVLQDEQNEVLDRLRQERRPTAASVLPSLDDQVERYKTAALPLLSQAADRGSEFVVSPDDRTDGDKANGSPSRGWDVEQWAADLAIDLVVPLRDRLEAAISDAAADPVASGTATSDTATSDTMAYDVSGVSERVGASYRQWKATQIEQAARHHANVAFGEGAFSATPPGAQRCWVVDDDGPCPDCDDNTLAGTVTKGHPFPTGQTHPPAHGGCRCILVAPPS